jgi:hypothetical protein
MKMLGIMNLAERGILSEHPKKFSVAMVKLKSFVVNQRILEKTILPVSLGNLRSGISFEVLGSLGRSNAFRALRVSEATNCVQHSMRRQETCA